MSTLGTTVAATIGDIFRSASLQQARQFSGCDSLEVLEMEKGFQLGQVISPLMTLIVISGAEMSVLFKVHFKSSEGDRLRRIKFSDPSIDGEVAVAKTADYMKELTNRIGGHICRTFQRNDLTLGMCIPLSISGFYELYADYTPGDRFLTKFGEAWKITGEFGSLACTAYVEISNIKAVAHLQNIDEQAPDDDSELEFL